MKLWRCDLRKTWISGLRPEFPETLSEATRTFCDLSHVSALCHRYGSGHSHGLSNGLTATEHVRLPEK